MGPETRWVVGQHQSTLHVGWNSHTLLPLAAYLHCRRVQPCRSQALTSVLFPYAY